MIAATADECILHTGAGNRLVTQSSHSLGIRAGLSYHRLLRCLSAVSGKLSCCVLRGVGAGDSPCLPGGLKIAMFAGPGDYVCRSLQLWVVSTIFPSRTFNVSNVVCTGHTKNLMSCSGYSCCRPRAVTHFARKTRKSGRSTAD